MHLIDKCQGHTDNKWERQDVNPDLSDPRCECLTTTHIALVSVPPWIVSWLGGQTLESDYPNSSSGLVLNYMCDVSYFPKWTSHHVLQGMSYS